MSEISNKTFGKTWASITQSGEKLPHHKHHEPQQHQQQHHKQHHLYYQQQH